MPNTQLSELWGFDDADLGANRLGQLTEKQKKFLAGEQKSNKTIYAGIGIFVALVFCCLPLLVMGSRMLLPMLLSSQSSSSPADMIPMVGMGIFALIFGVVLVLIVGGTLVILYLRGNQKADISVKKAEGIVNFVKAEKRVRAPSTNLGYKDIFVLEMRVGSSKNFTDINESLPNIINQGEKWVIYYTSYPFKFLSGEIITKEK